jgi:o-succinylbenzoate synthase
MVDQTYFRLNEEIEFEWEDVSLVFKSPARTSRNVMIERPTSILKIWHKSSPKNLAYGECAPLISLSPESLEEAKIEVERIIYNMNANKLYTYQNCLLSSSRFCLESALFMLNAKSFRPKSIPINGLVWMNDQQTMLSEAVYKAASGFDVVKLKIGGIDFQDELALLTEVRKQFPQITIRLDANGAFSNKEAKDKLNALTPFGIHSIEQPIKAGQWSEMAQLIRKSPIPIALDEELIGIMEPEQMGDLLDTIKPNYIILKPSLHGGFTGCDLWIQLAQERNIRWWATSALESNIGLNQIAKWICDYDNLLSQGLGTGGLFINNFLPEWEVKNGKLEYISK